MRYIRYAFYAALAIVLVNFSVANLGSVTLNTLPSGVAAVPGMGWLSFSLELPLFVIVLGSLILGVVLGEVLEWFREHKIRVDANQKGQQVRKLERELKKTQAERDKDKDEVLALLDQAS
ncbi:MAG: lipopolysaccharide assembly protein LapA domain-containing protein [Pelagimonas sp.]|uniref:lipopolysaccharide assembly protein LapA domain-containing protein n=1 Tax=Pelagimonas sp. TaxID=2073170 RepID=UPI003D6BDDE9